MELMFDLPEQQKNEFASIFDETSDSDSIFDRYKTGTSPSFSAFRLYSTDASVEENESDCTSPMSRVRGFYRKYTELEKKIAVDKILNGHDIKEIANEYGIPKRNLLRWRKNGCERKEGGGRPTDHKMEITLYEKIKNRLINGEKEIRAAAIEMSQSENFKASKGWFSKFCGRYKTTTGEDIRSLKN